MMNKFFEAFEDYCKSPGVDSGKAKSYARAIEYLCNYLKIDVIDRNAVIRIKAIEDSINDKNSALYKDLLSFLSGRRQSSYLSKGFVKAALKYFFEYCSKNVD